MYKNNLRGTSLFISEMQVFKQDYIFGSHQAIFHSPHARHLNPKDLNGKIPFENKTIKGYLRKSEHYTFKKMK